MGKAVLSILIAFLGNSIMNISQATQKIGLGQFSHKKSRGVFLWILGTLGITAATFVIMYAVSIGNVSLVGAMAGAGLASLTLFSKFVMKEDVGRKEIIGVIIIFAAAALIGAFSHETPATTIRLNVLFLFLAIIATIYILGWIFSARSRLAGIVIGGFSGAMGGFVPLFQKVATSEVGQAAAFIRAADGGNPSGLMAMFANVYALIWVALSIVALLILQFSYKKDDAIRIIPAYAANYILIPVIGGVLCFKEILLFWQWLGVGLIFLGVFFITIKKKANDAKSC